MSTTHSEERHNESANDKRRKRKARATSRTPEPKDIVSGAGRPLELSVRRELEEQLGHDFSRVRLHTDRDAGALMELLGADAVAVGQDIFFREGAYRPGTADGQHLLAHELLHTVQNPDGLGALRAGRDLGAVSLPQQAMEREAESAARESVRDGEAAPEVRRGDSTPGWLRYATVDADLRRQEQLDPATLVDRLTNSLLRSLRGDPEDRSRRVRTQLGRFSPELQDAVLDRLEPRLLSSERERLIDLVEESEESDSLGVDALSAPAAVPDAVELLEGEPERSGEAERRPGPEQGETTDPGQQKQRGPASNGDDRTAGPGAQQPAGTSGGTSRGTQASEQGGGGRSSANGDRSSADKKTDTGSRQQGRKDSGEGADAPEVSGAPTAGEEESAAKNRPGAVDPLVAGGQPRGADRRRQDDQKSAGVEPGALLRTADLGSRSTLEGIRSQDGELEDEPPGPESGTDSVPEELDPEKAFDEDSAWNTELGPEDFLPASDLDVSGVPTADKITPGRGTNPSMPSFPEPPGTKAEEVQARRDEEDAAESDAGDDELARPMGADGDAHDSPAARAEAEGRRLDALQVEKPVEQEVGPPPSSDASAGDRSGPAEPMPEVRDRESAAQEAERSEPDQGNQDQDREQDQDQGQSSERSGAQASAGGTAESATASSTGSSTASDTGSSTTSGSSTASAPGATGSGTGRASSSGTGVTSPAPTADASGGTSGGSRRSGDASSGEQNSGTGTSTEVSPARDTHVSGAGGSAETTGGGAPESGTEARRSDAHAAAPITDEPAAAPAAEPTQGAAPASSRPSGSASSRTVKGGGGTRSASGGGGGGGRSRGAAPARPKRAPAAPNLSQVSPEAGLSTAANLKPHVALEALGGVNSAVDRTVGEEHQALQAAPPTTERPSGAPQTLSGAPNASAPGEYSSDPAAQVDAPEQEEAEVAGDQTPEGEIPGMEIEEPSKVELGLAAGGQAVAGIVNGVSNLVGGGDIIDTDALMGWILDLPTEDEMLAQASVGMAPGVGLEGETGGRVDEQSGEVDSKGQELLSSGRDDAGRPLGEDQIYPDVPQETLTAQVPGAQGQSGGTGQGGGAAAGGRIPPEAVSEVAEHERGPQLQSAFSDGRRTMSDKRQAKDDEFRQSQERHRQDVRSEIETNTRTQAAERERTTTEVEESRTRWRTRQDEELDSLGTKKSDKIDKIREEASDKETKTDEAVETRRTADEEKIGKKRTTAEENARSERDTAKSDSGNWISRAFDYIRDKLNELKDAIIDVFRAARAAITSLITDFKGTVLGWIETAREEIIGLFEEFTEALIQLGRDLLDGLLEIANQIRDLIIEIRDAAIALVNQIADDLRQLVDDLLDQLGEMLSGLLDALREGLRMAVDAVMSGLRAIMDFALGLLNALGEWAMIAADIITDPGAWLSGVAASAEDGARNYLFQEITSAVKNWFNEKIQEVLGLPREIFDALLNGGVSKEQMAQEAWEEAQPQLPFIIGEIVITKVIAKLIPGAGWVLAIIDALKAAWGALNEILQAFGAFMDYLKAVKGGNAGLLFAKAVASGVVALLELAYQALLSGVARYVKKVGDRLKGVAEGFRRDRPAPGTPGRPQTPPRPQDPTRPNNPNRPQATERPRPDDQRRRNQETRAAQQQARRTTDEQRRPPRPSRGATPRPTARPRPNRTNDRTNDRDRRNEPDRTDQNTPQDRTRPRREPNTARPTQRRRPTSPAARAMNRARQTVRAALNRTRRAKDALGRRDTDNRRRRDLDNNARRMRDAYARRRDLLRRQQRTREEQRRQHRDQRRRKENSPESKDDRLRRIVARIRPTLARLLSMGVRGPVLRAVLAAMRAWHRLTQLTLNGTDRFTVQALLNPSERVIVGDTVDIGGVRVETNRMLRAIRRIGIEIFEAGGLEVNAGGGVENFQEDLPLRGGDLRPSISGGPGSRGGTTQHLLRMRNNLNPRRGDTIREVAHTGEELDAQRNKGSGWNPGRANRVVQVQFPGDPQPVSLGYSELPDKLKAMRRTHGNTAVNQVIANVLRFARGRKPVGSHLELSWQLYVWLIQQESHRNIGTLATHAMVLDMMNRNKVTAAQAAQARWHAEAIDPQPIGRALPAVANPAYEGYWSMQPKGSESRARNLPLYLDDTLPVRDDQPKRWENLPEINRLAAREIKSIQLWVNSLSDFKVSSNSEAKTKEEQLILEIRRRVLAIYGITATGDEDFLDSLMDELNLHEQSKYGGRG
ncbi:DUF4157 domain-containing protein [Streptomyces sp. NPDC051662]|uniref:eCIS core domain-containing protein n=1 Tax=Streptomyces sp. NPDC051662 TaxID=3154750 RepID=UPI0034178011